MASGRIYVVEDADSVSLVRAVSAGKALNHVCKSQYQVRVATADDVADLMAQGATIDDTTITVGTMEVADPELAEVEDQE